MAVPIEGQFGSGVTSGDPWWNAVGSLHSMMKLSSALCEMPESNEDHMAASRVLRTEIENLAAALNQIRHLQGK
jgi:hypothetical protein